VSEAAHGRSAVSQDLALPLQEGVCIVVGLEEEHEAVALAVGEVVEASTLDEAQDGRVGEAQVEEHLGGVRLDGGPELVLGDHLVGEV
jgi:hypothetical protein